uniref:(northern house mosquito) hypothetical protein n=1 Tax=Culex pipiens TaxID=7175 RepID=A0A8D8CM76_CULPI
MLINGAINIKRINESETSAAPKLKKLKTQQIRHKRHVFPQKSLTKSVCVCVISYELAQHALISRATGASRVYFCPMGSSSWVRTLLILNSRMQQTPAFCSASGSSRIGNVDALFTPSQIHVRGRSVRPDSCGRPRQLGRLPLSLPRPSRPVPYTDRPAPVHVRRAGDR